jgi:hypothetical protein
MRTRSFIALTCALLSAALFAADAPRFSQSLTAEQRTATGIDRLDSDQLAALDALVRLSRNQTAAAALKAERAKADSQKQSAPATPAATAPTAVATAAAPEPQPVAFSQSLSADQRRAAGLDQLTAEQQSAIDTLVAVQAPALPTYRPALASSPEAVQFFPNRFEVHGQVGFSFGAGSGGYSSRAAWLNTTLLDTKTGTEIGVTIATGREKWKTPFGYRDNWDSYGLSLGVPVLGGP